MSEAIVNRNDADRMAGGRTERMIFVTVVLAGTICLSSNSADPDLWGHVRYGQDALRAGRLPATATHTFTAEGFPWVNHENIPEIAMAAAVNLGGPAGLIALGCLIRLAVVGMLAARGREQRVSPFTLCVLVLLACLNLAPSFNYRPQLFSYLFFTFEVLLIDRLALIRPASVRDGIAQLARMPQFWGLACLFAAWTNSHGGFLAGLGVLGFYLACRAVATLVSEGKAALPTAICFGAVVAASMLATLVNPYGWRYHEWLYYDLSIPRPEITEWARLTWRDPSFIPFVILVALSIAAVATDRSTVPWPRIATIAVTIWQAVEHHRHLPFFAILAALWLPAAFESMRQKWLVREEVDARGGASSRELAVPTAVWALVIAALLGGLSYRNRGIFVDAKEYPVSAFQFMEAHELKGKLVVFFNWAQYALAAFSPPMTVEFDGRFRTCYPQEVADRHFDLMLGDLPGLRSRLPESGPIDPHRALDAGAPDLVLFPRTLPTPVATLEARSDWVLLYQDGLAQLWGRKSRYDEPSSDEYLPPEGRQIGAEPQSGLARWPAFPR